MIEMLDMKKNWGTVKAAFKGGPYFKSLAAQPSLRFVQGFEPMQLEATQRQSSTKSTNAFSGKTFSKKLKSK